MWSYAQERKAETHRKIVKAASRLFRKHGYKNTGIEKVMKSLKLTVGGFYAHFKSKDALLAEALECTMTKGRPLAYQLGMDTLSPAEWVEEVMNRLLNDKQRRDLEHGCPLAALMNEVSRCPSVVKAQYEAEILKNLDVMSPRVPAIANTDKRREALFFLTVLLGSISLARAVHTDELAEEVLEASRSTMLRRARGER